MKTVDEVETLKSALAAAENEVAQLKAVTAATKQTPLFSADTAVAFDGKTVLDGTADCLPEIFEKFSKADVAKVRKFREKTGFCPGALRRRTRKWWKWR